MSDHLSEEKNISEKTELLPETEAVQSVSAAFMCFVEAWKKYFIVTGRTGRTQFWSFIIFNVIISGLVRVVIGIQGMEIYLFISFFPMWAAAVRRLHDTGRSGLWTLPSVVLSFISGFFIHSLPAAAVRGCSFLSLIFLILLVFFLFQRGREKK
ncbi:MAG: DUF805 domain-containing protein [Alphaproteobacteria bacterium]|nr:DUF805 domain-containing protein [Alphaproteobacteria bacterium]